jgi:hypothetical protein
MDDGTLGVRHARTSGLRLTVVVALLATLGACGGGSGGSANPGGPSPPPSPPPTPSSVSLDATSVSVSAYSANLAPQPASIAVSIINSPTTEFGYRVSASGAAVTGSSFAWQSTASGTLSINFASPGQLGPGVYQGSVQLSVCYDAACLQPIGGSPATVSVTYTVNAGTQPTTSFTISPGPGGITSPLYTSQTTTILDNFSLYVTNIPSSGLWVQVTQPPGGFVTDAALQPFTGPSAVIGLTIKSPATLGSGVYNGSATFNLCFDQTCQNQVPGSPVTEPISFVVSLTAGLEYVKQNIMLPGAYDIAWDSANQQLYATTVSGGAIPDSLVQINPVTGEIGPSVSLGVDLWHVAISGDGQYAYVSSNTQPTVYRVQLPSLVSDLQILLGSSTGGSGTAQPNTVSQMQVAPGNPQSLAVSLAVIGGSELQIFDGAVSRQNILAPLGYYQSAPSIAWSDTAAVLYALRYSQQQPLSQELDALAVNASGLTLTNSLQISTLDPVLKIFYAGGRIYGLDGNVRDASTGAVIGQIVLPTGYSIINMIPDVANGRVFILANAVAQSLDLILFCYDSSTLTMLSLADLGFNTIPGPYPSDFILWGSNGIAFNAGGDAVTVLSGSFATGSKPSTGALKGIAPVHVH